MIAFTLLCVVALALFIGLATSVYFCYNAQRSDGQMGFGLLSAALIVGFIVCVANAVMRADALDKEPQRIEQRK